MTRTKNLYVPADLLARIEALARGQGRTADEMAEQSLRETLDFQNLLSQGHAQASSHGFEPSDVLRNVAEYRRDNSGRNR